MQTANIALAAAGLISWILYAIQLRRKWMWSVGPITIFLHVIVFYVVRLSIGDPLTPEMKLFFNEWSGGLRFHTLIILTCMGIGLALERRYRWTKRKSLLQ